jgi:GNAT superfamily N-acetyltransferase
MGHQFLELPSMPARKLELTTENQINADIALKNRLYVSGYMLSGVLVKIRSGKLDARVVIHVENDIPVGVAVTDFSHFSYYGTMVFVRKSMRNRGIGSKLLEKLNASKNTRVGVGCTASSKFWRKNGFYYVC